MTTKRKAYSFILGGVLVFLLRYVPFYHYNSILVNKWFSIDSARDVCSSGLGGFVSQCDWMNPLNTIFIFSAIVLAVIGIVLLIKKSQN